MNENKSPQKQRYKYTKADKPFSKLFIVLTYIGLVLSASVAISQTYFSFQFFTQYEWNLFIPFVPLITTLANIYFIVILIIRYKRVEGFYLFLISHIISPAITYAYLSSLLPNLSYSDTDFYTTLIKVFTFMGLLLLQKNGLSGWDILFGEAYPLEKSNELSSKVEVGQLQEQNLPKQSLDVEYTLECMVEIDKLLASGKFYKIDIERGILLVGKMFMDDFFDKKEHSVEIFWKYCKMRKHKHTKLLIKDEKNGHLLGTYTENSGLIMENI